MTVNTDAVNGKEPVKTRKRLSMKPGAVYARKYAARKKAEKMAAQRTTTPQTLPATAPKVVWMLEELSTFSADELEVLKVLLPYVRSKTENKQTQQ